MCPEEITSYILPGFCLSHTSNVYIYIYMSLVYTYMRTYIYIYIYIYTYMYTLQCSFHASVSNMLLDWKS